VPDTDDAPMPDAEPPRPNRRTVLTGTAAAVVGVAGIGVFGRWLLKPKSIATPVTPTTVPRTALDGPTPPAVQSTPFQSGARGRTVNVVVIRPEGTPVRDLPVCLALHGRGADATMFANLGVPAALTAAVTAGTPAYAVVSVDGGDRYWTAADPADDPRAMLSDELPGWLAELGLRPEPRVLMGISMGAFGALGHARTHHSAATAAISPALFTSWNEARLRSVFASKAQWEEAEPLRHTQDLNSTALGVWCGTDDPFAPAARQLVEKARPERAELTDGAHDEAYWTAVLPDVLRWLGTHI